MSKDEKQIPLSPAGQEVMRKFATPIGSPTVRDVAWAQEIASALQVAESGSTLEAEILVEFVQRIRLEACPAPTAVKMRPDCRNCGHPAAMHSLLSCSQYCHVSACECDDYLPARESGR